MGCGGYYGKRIYGSVDDVARYCEQDKRCIGFQYYEFGNYGNECFNFATSSERSYYVTCILSSGNQPYFLNFVGYKDSVSYQINKFWFLNYAFSTSVPTQASRSTRSSAATTNNENGK